MFIMTFLAQFTRKIWSVLTSSLLPQLTEIQTHYDEVQRQLQVTLDQYGVAQRRIQSLTGEVEEIRGNYEQVRQLSFGQSEITSPAFTITITYSNTTL